MIYLTDDGRTRPEPKERTTKKLRKKFKPVPLPVPDFYRCLIRARYKKKKIATVVSSTVDQFSA